MKRILVIEDDKDIVELVRYNLEKDGYQVAPAGDGATGLAQIRKAPPDLLILDLMLPETFRSGYLQGSSPGRQLESLADSDSHGEGRRSGPRRRSRTRRGRLRHQTVQPARTCRARESAPAPRRAGNALGESPRNRRAAHRSGGLSRDARRETRSDEHARIPSSLFPGGAAQSRLHARPIARRRVGHGAISSRRAAWMFTSAGCAKKSKPIRSIRST